MNSVVVKGCQVPSVLIHHIMVASSAILVLIHAATPSPRLVFLTRTCGANSLPYSCVTPLNTDFRFLCERKISFEISFHGFGRNIIFFFLDDSLISQSVNSSPDLFFRGSRIAEDIPKIVEDNTIP